MAHKDLETVTVNSRSVLKEALQTTLLMSQAYIIAVIMKWTKQFGF